MVVSTHRARFVTVPRVFISIPFFFKEKALAIYWVFKYPDEAWDFEPSRIFLIRGPPSLQT